MSRPSAGGDALFRFVDNPLIPIDNSASEREFQNVAKLRLNALLTGEFTINAKEDGRVGPAASVMLGKEWCVSRKWGRGLAAQVIFASLDTDNGTGLGVLGVGLVFSAAMN